jgi:soluble lytic murein transglycosylase-like protein
VQSLILKLQSEVESRKRPTWDTAATLRSAALAISLCLVAYHAGARSVEPAATPAPQQQGAAGVQSLEGMVELQNLELERLRRIYENSVRFGIPADLAERIEDIAQAEGIDPSLAFGLVRAESEFKQTAVSPVGAVGYTQLMPTTARFLKPDVSRAELFDRDTNLRIGFRYLRTLIDAYDGNVHLALLAYNRGPGRVNQLLRQGVNPDNGYVRMVLGR